MNITPSQPNPIEAPFSLLSHTRLLRVLVALLLLAAALEVASPARAKLLAPTDVGRLIVNSAGDNVAVDSVLTLREAMLAAKGSAISGWTAGEQAQMPACLFNGSGDIIGGCGAGLQERIVFDPGLGGAPTIALASSLPIIDDSNSLMIDGGVVFPILDGGAIPADTDILIITSNGHTVNSLSITNSRRHGVRIEGDNNILDDVYVSNNLGSGIAILGGRVNTLDGVVAGISSAISTTCAGNGASGVLLGLDANNNAIRNSTLVCNAIAGVALSTGTTVSNTVGPDNYIGVNAGGTALANVDGVVIEGSASGNSVYSNTIRSNSATGVKLWTDARNNTVTSNLIRGNGGFGVALESGSFNNVIDSNTVAENASYGIRIDGGTTHSNSISGNLIGIIAAPGFTLAGNGLSGIFMTGRTHHNAFSNNTIAANNGHGIVVSDSYTNTFSSDVIGRTPTFAAAATRARISSALASFGNSGMGMRISGGSSGNLIEGAEITENALGGINITGGSHDNVISWTRVYSHTAPGVNGVMINEASNSNVLDGVQVGASAGVGVLIDGSAFTRIRNSMIGRITLGSDTTAGNGLDGVRLTNGAQNNIIGGQDSPNIIEGNGGSGILISGGTTNNANCVGGNYLGVLSGPNGSPGSPAAAIHVDDAGSGNVIGYSPSCSAMPIAGNMIISATSAGIMVNGAASDSTVIAGNMIISSTGAGIHVMGGASHSVVGSPAYGNYIAHGRADGIRIDGGSSNVVQANQVGFNALYGIGIADSSINTIGSNGVTTDTGNALVFNGKAGVIVSGNSSTGNRISRNVINGNTGLSINLGGGTEDGFDVTENDAGDTDSGPNALLNFPSSLTASLTSTLISGVTPADGIVEIYLLDTISDDSGHGEAFQWIGDATASGGRFSFTLPQNYWGRCVTTLFIDASNNTSELSANLCLPKRVLLPLVRR